MAFLEDIRVAIQTKANSIEALRMASLGRSRNTGGLPQVFVQIPIFDMQERPGAATEIFNLQVPGLLAVGVPAREVRADTEALDLLWALIVEWRSGIGLGLSDQGVVGSWLSHAAPSYRPTEDGGTLLEGYELAWTVPVLQTLTPLRTI